MVISMRWARRLCNWIIAGGLVFLAAVLDGTWTSPADAVVCKRTELPTLIANGLSAPARVWCVSPPLSSRKLKDQAADVSAIGCVSRSLCVVASDETRFVQVVRLDHERYQIVPQRFVYLGDTAVTGKGNDRKDPPELDIEAAAVLDGRVLVVGSHGKSRQGEDHGERRIVMGFQLDEELLDRWPAARSRNDEGRPRADGTISIEPVQGDKARSMIDVLVEAVDPKPDGALRQSRDRCLQDNGFNVEGIDLSDTDLVVGLRGPLVDGKAVVLAAQSEAFLAGTIKDARIYFLTLDGLSGIRSITRFRSGYLLLTGRSQPEPAEEGRCAEFPQGALAQPALYFWGGPEQPDQLHEVARFSEKRHKPEALAVLGADAKELDILVFFDGGDNGIPTSYRVPFTE